MGNIHIPFVFHLHSPLGGGESFWVEGYEITVGVHLSSVSSQWFKRTPLI